MYFFTSDEHYNHKNIIKYTNRPFKTIEEMNGTLIANHNEVVKDEDFVINAGDFAFGDAEQIIDQLKGYHIFLRGSHDKWLSNIAPYIWERKIQDEYVVVCHYAMRVWPRSHYNSWQCFGHSHGKLEPIGKQWDIGVDNNNFYPISFTQLKKIMEERPNNPNLVLKLITEKVK